MTNKHNAHRCTISNRAETMLNRELRRAERRATRIWLDAKRFFASRDNEDNEDESRTLTWSTPTEEQKTYDKEERARIKRIDALLSKM